MAARRFTLGSVRTTVPPLERFDEFLAQRQKRLTKQRRLIVECVFSHHDHFDADELMRHLAQWIESRELSRPTIYRTLAELCAAGMLRAMTLQGRSVYEHDYGYPSHDHLHCERCNRLIEFHSRELEQIRDAVARQHHFQVHGHRMFVSGLCAECAAKDVG
jgi:Fur family transcriptional regulator, ferric uptake regulator